MDRARAHNVDHLECGDCWVNSYSREASQRVRREVLGAADEYTIHLDPEVK